MALEEPKYTTITQTNDYEIRKYEDRLAVETLEGSGENRAFSLLFKYISGANELNSKVAMTIPVTQSTKIDMTAPVTQLEVNGDRIMCFFLSTKFTMEDSPRPTSVAVRLVMVKCPTYAVTRYSARSSDQNFFRNAHKLGEALKRDGVQTSGDPIKATYNRPFRTFFLSRNEVMISVEEKGAHNVID